MLTLLNESLLWWHWIVFGILLLLLEISKSNNAKFVIYPSDVQSTIKRMRGSVFK